MKPSDDSEFLTIFKWILLLAYCRIHLQATARHRSRVYPEISRPPWRGLPLLLTLSSVGPCPSRSNLKEEYQLIATLSEVRVCEIGTAILSKKNGFSFALCFPLSHTFYLYPLPITFYLYHPPIRTFYLYPLPLQYCIPYLYQRCFEPVAARRVPPNLDVLSWP
jgi:hypothetical protein